MYILAVLLAGVGVELPVGIGLAGAIIGHVLKGNFHTDNEMRERLSEQKDGFEKQMVITHQGYADSQKMMQQAHDFQIQAMTERMDKILAERDGAIGTANAWKSAADWNNEGRLEAQRAAAVVLDAGEVSKSLLGVVRELMFERKPPNAG